MMKNAFEALLKKLVDEKYDDIICPPKDEIWQKLEGKISYKQKELSYLIYIDKVKVKTISKKRYRKLIIKNE